jgi:transcriptional regulator with XRE-family HTH domain
MVTLPRLKRLRERAALSQEELGEQAGLARTTVLRLEKGGEAPYPSTIRKLARALGVRPDQLMGPMEEDE